MLASDALGAITGIARCPDKLATAENALLVEFLFAISFTEFAIMMFITEEINC
jgi:hypothetical protein